MSKSNPGICFPKTKDGKASTIDFNLKLIHYVLHSSQNQIEAADFVSSNKKEYRQKYPKLFVDMTMKFLESRDSALFNAKKGLDYVQSHIIYRNEDGKELTLKEKMNENTENVFKTKEIVGKFSSEDDTEKYTVPYKGKNLTEKDLSNQLVEWANEGVMEQDARNALALLISTETEDLKELLEDHCFVLIGAGSAMGPFETLVKLGATIVALDIPSERVWRRLKTLAEDSKNATVYYPYKNTENGEIAGCDLLRQPAEILAWLKSLSVIKEKKVTIGNYTYLDGSLHVLLSAAADAVIEGLSKHLENELNIAFLCTPTDVSIVPKEAYYASRERYFYPHFGRTLEFLIFLISFGTQLRRNDIKLKKDHYLYNGLVVAQGPNYALAKMIQLWRGVVHYCSPSQGKLSLNVAPGTATVSVVHNRMFSMAFKGMPYFKPVEIFKQETSNSLMAGLMLKDIMDRREKDKELNPVVLKSQQAIHGGVWRSAYSQNTIGMSSVLVHILGGPELFVYTVMALLFSPIFLFVFTRM